jgi:hypothetical protein
VDSLINALAETIGVDTTVSNSDIEHLVLDMPGLGSKNIAFATVPYKGTGQVGSQSVVFLNRSLDQGFWHAFAYDTLPAFMATHGLQPLGATTP